MKVLASDEAVAYVRGRGGVVFVWAETGEFATGPVTYLEASTDSPGPERAFRRMTGGPFDLLLDIGGRETPDAIHLEMKGLPGRRRLRAYWDGHSFARGGS